MFLNPALQLPQAEAYERCHHQKCESRKAGAPLPKFARHRGSLLRELRKKQGHRKKSCASADFRFEVPVTILRRPCRNFKSAAPVPPRRHHPAVAVISARGRSGGLGLPCDEI